MKGFDTCSLCDETKHISDPQMFTIDEERNKHICKNCFLYIHTSISWGAEVKTRIVFEYQKETIKHSLKWAVWKRDGFECKKCFATENLSVDHIHPESLGGDLSMDNLQTLCRLCNSRKSNKI